MHIIYECSQINLDSPHVQMLDGEMDTAYRFMIIPLTVKANVSLVIHGPRGGNNNTKSYRAHVLCCNAT